MCTSCNSWTRCICLTEQYQSVNLENTATYFKTRVSSLIACTATSYSLSRVMETIRSWERAKEEWDTVLMSYWAKGSNLMSVQVSVGINLILSPESSMLKERDWEVWDVVSKFTSRWCSPWSDWWRVPILHWALCCSRDPAGLSDTSDVPHLAGKQN